METQIVNTFRLGRSTVVTLPKKSGITPGTALKVIISKKGEVILRTNKQASSRDSKIKKDIKKIEKLAGGLKFGKGVTPEIINKWIEESYDDDKSLLP